MRDIHSVHKAYQDRIGLLMDYADEDGFSINRASEDDFWSFIKSFQRPKKGSLFLRDNGNLRVLWSGEEGNQIGIQFLGGGSVQYVIFKSRSKDFIDRVSGQGSPEGVEGQIYSFGLGSLICT